MGNKNHFRIDKKSILKKKHIVLTGNSSHWALYFSLPSFSSIISDDQRPLILASLIKVSLCVKDKVASHMNLISNTQQCSFAYFCCHDIQLTQNIFTSGAGDVKSCQIRKLSTRANVYHSFLSTDCLWSNLNSKIQIKVFPEKAHKV